MSEQRVQQSSFRHNSYQSAVSCYGESSDLVFPHEFKRVSDCFVRFYGYQRCRHNVLRACFSWVFSSSCNAFNYVPFGHYACWHAA